MFLIAFTTKRYAGTPLVVQGPGAGADVTAMGVFSDILKLLHISRAEVISAGSWVRHSHNTGTTRSSGVDYGDDRGSDDGVVMRGFAVE